MIYLKDVLSRDGFETIKMPDEILGPVFLPGRVFTDKNIKINHNFKYIICPLRFEI